jgi:GYF domain 2
MAQWFMIRDGKELGPFTAQQLKDMATSGKLRTDDLVRREDMQRVTKAGTVKGLFAANSASTFSLRFWFQNLSPTRKALVGVPAGCLSLCVLGFCFLCVVGIIVGPTKQQKATTEPTARTEKQEPASPSSKEAGDGLTALFLPCVAGNVKRYEEEVYDPVDGRATVSTEDRETYGNYNTLTVERTIKSPGIPPSRVTFRGERRESNGYVELVINQIVRVRVKVGANPGDEWPGTRGDGKYRLIRFDKTVAQGAKGPYELLQAVIEHRWEAVDGRGEKTVTVTEIVLERDSGIQSEKSFMLVGGQKKVLRHRRLITSTY